MNPRKSRWLGLALVASTFAAGASLDALLHDRGAAPADATAPPAEVEPQRQLLAAKDCSAMQSCYDRCQCQYDNCIAACGDTDAACTNACIANWNACRDYC